MHERWIHYVIVHLEVPLVCELKYIVMSNVYTRSVLMRQQTMGGRGDC